MTALYIHIPFCVRKCAYCDFVSFAGAGGEMIDSYVDVLCRELEERAIYLREGISTVYLGGGTPVLISPRHVEKIFSGIRKICPDFPGDREITMEANPGAANTDKLKMFRDMGISRISLGVQSFNDRMLGILGRIHTACDAARTYENCRRAGFENINLDLMFALPDQTLSLWREDIRRAVSLAPQHISCYNLQVEENTPMWNRKYPEEGDAGERLVFPDEEADAKMYEFAAEYLRENNYQRYEISNFALPGRESLHNIAYWKNADYLGLGVAAHSHIAGERWANTSSLNDYLDSPEKSIVERRKADPFFGRQETIFLGLRMDEGVKAGLFEGFEKDVEELLGEGLIEEHSGRYRLTGQGVLLGNRVFSHFV